jgi:acetyl esterase/lipase
MERYKILTYRQISGDSNAVPNWLVKAALRRRWTLVSANYRTLPESTGFDLSEDLVDAYRYVSNSGNNSLSHDLNKPGLIDPSRIIIAGHSGGGYSAVLATLEVLKRISTSDLKKPVATVAVYPMLDFLSPKWSCEGVDLGTSKEDFEAGRKDLERRLASKEVSFGERFPDNEADIIHHSRWDLMRYILKAPLFVDYFSGVKGLGEKLASAQSASPSTYETAREEIVPLEARPLFVLDFGNLTSAMPPLFVLHGLADTAVPFEDSDRLTEKTKTLGIPTRYWRLEGLDHDFDLEFPDLESTEAGNLETGDIGRQAVREMLKGLDAVLET